MALTRKPLHRGIVFCWFTHLHVYVYTETMKTAAYRAALYEAKQDVARHLVKRQKLDHKIAQLQALVTNLQNLSAARDRKNFEKGVDRVIKASTDVGVTDCVRVILKETFLPMTAAEIKKTIEDRKYNLTVYKNPLAVIHTILKRLVKSDELRVIPQSGGKKAYQWISTADKLLSEIQNSNQSAIQKHGKSTESK